jgi:heme exporter protein A
MAEPTISPAALLDGTRDFPEVLLAAPTPHLRLPDGRRYRLPEPILHRSHEGAASVPYRTAVLGCRGRSASTRSTSATHHGATLTSAIDARSVGRRFGSRWVLRGVSFEVRGGEVVGLLGPNGSGKSTVLRILGTLLAPSSGSVSVHGIDVVRDARAVRSQVGYLAHTPGLYEDLTARENLRFAAEMLGLPHDAAEESLMRVGLERVGGERVRSFSAGMQRRLALARLTLLRPRVLLMDEPYSNLDADGIALMNDVIAGVVRNGGAALLVLHELAPASRILDRTLTLAEGRIAESGAEALARNQLPTHSGAH